LLEEGKGIKTSTLQRRLSLLVPGVQRGGEEGKITRPRILWRGKDKGGNSERGGETPSRDLLKGKN